MNDQWEYTGVSTSVFSDYNKLGKRIDALGKEGFELVSTDPQTVFGCTIGTYLWFKRRLVSAKGE